MGASFKQWLSDNHESNSELLKKTLEIAKQLESEGFKFEDLTGEPEPSIRVDMNDAVSRTLRENEKNAPRSAAPDDWMAPVEDHGPIPTQFSLSKADEKDREKPGGKYVFDVGVCFGDLVAHRVARRSDGRVVRVSGPIQIKVVAYDEESGEESPALEKAIDGFRAIAVGVAEELQAARSSAKKKTVVDSPFSVSGAAQGLGLHGASSGSLVSP